MDVPINIKTPTDRPSLTLEPEVNENSSDKTNASIRRSDGDDTRRRLILSAVILGSRRPFSTVPMRAIVELSGSNNISAAHYHFKNREGLLRAIIAEIDKAWPAALPASATGNVQLALTHFLHNLNDLKGENGWEPFILPFLTRLCMEGDLNCQKTAEDLLAQRLYSVYKAVEACCGDNAAINLRLRVSNACLTLMVASSQLNECYWSALGGNKDFKRDLDFSHELIEMAIGMIGCDASGASDGPEPDISQMTAPE